MNSIITLLIGGLMIGNVYGVVGMGFSLIYKATGLMNLAQGDFLMFGAYIGLTYFKIFKLPYGIAIVLTFITMFALGWIVQLGLISPLLKKGAQVAYVILCTAAVSMVLQNGAMILWGAQVQFFPSIFNTTSIRIFGVRVAPESLLVLGMALLCAFGLHFFLKKTKFGTAMRAAALSQKAASAIGINVPLTKGFTWGLSAALAGVIGATLGPIYGVFISFGALIGQKAFAGAVSGGYGNIYGAMIGGIFFGLLETFTSAFITTTYKDLMSFAVLMIVMIIMPTGLFREQTLE